jgi:ferredoxin
VKAFLVEKGYAPNVAEGMMRAMPNASLYSFKQLGKPGLAALSGAVAREIVDQEQRRQLPKVDVVIVPFGCTVEGGGVRLTANEGMTVYDLWGENQETLGPLMECACQGIAACSTCHVILEQDTYDALAAQYKVSTSEMDMLDLAEGLTPTSRLGCQLNLRKIGGSQQQQPGEEGEEPIVLRLPETTNNLW